MTEGNIIVNALGEHIQIREDGTRIRVHHESPVKAKILAAEEANKRDHVSLHEKKMRHVEFKRAQQRKKGFPSEKSPI